MTTSPTANGNGKERDDLTRIKGIGSVTQQLLRESFGIRTFGDLTELSVDEIESRLRDQGQTTSRREIEDWLAQAGELAAAAELRAKEPPERETEEPSKVSTQEGEIPQSAEASAEGETEETTPAEEGEWSSLASFMVQFQSRILEGQTAEKQTVVRYQEADRVKTWSGIESRQAYQWMLEQLEAVMPSAKPQSPQDQKAAAVSPPMVRIEQIQLRQPPQMKLPIVVDPASGLFPGSIDRGESLTVDIRFTLAGGTVADAAKERIQYRTQIYARDRATGATISVREETFEIPGKSELRYATVLPANVLPKPGMYRLQILVSLEGIPAIPGYFEIPLLQVV